MPKVRARFSRDDAGNGELSLEVASPPFAGASSAWFAVKELTGFAERLADAYPLSGANPMRLAGGYWEDAGSELKALHVGLSFSPVGSRGVVACTVHLAVPAGAGEERKASLEIELRCSYEALRAFARGLSAVARGEAEEAELECAEG